MDFNFDALKSFGKAFSDTMDIVVDTAVQISKELEQLD